MGGLNASRKQNDRLDLVKHKVLVSSWACRFDVDDCQEKAKSLFQSWMLVEDPEKNNPYVKRSHDEKPIRFKQMIIIYFIWFAFSVPLDLRSVVYCTAIRHGSDREWQFLWERYSKSNVGTERSLILSALGCSREIWLLQRYLDWTLDESTGVRKQDRGTVFGGVARNDIGLLLAKSFFFEKVEDIYKKLVTSPISLFKDAHLLIFLLFYSLLPDTSKLARYIDPLADQMVYGKEYDEFEHFFQNRSEIFSKISRNVEQSLEVIRNNNKWQERNYASIGRLLTEY